MKILDCTLRDGGYYTKWDFDPQLVDTYLESTNELPIDYIEVGYRSKTLEGYLGEYFYLPVQVMKRLREHSNKKLVIILNEKDIHIEDANELLNPCSGLIDLVRIAIDPKNFERSLKLATVIKGMGFKVGMNVMYMSTWKQLPNFLEQLEKVNGLADYFYMVDSFGGVYPEDVKEIFDLVSSIVSVPIGFHGHNNLELALINTLTAVECGVEIVDVTITGMGRGAGNLKTELLLTSLSAKGKIQFDFNALSKVVDGFAELNKKYEWGTNLPYMVSGANSLPQKEVMDWVGKRYYSFNSIIRALQNQSEGLKDNQQLKPFEPNMSNITGVIIGGGPSVQYHSKAIRAFLSKNKEMVLIHASSKNGYVFDELENQQIFCLVGNEGYRMEDVFKGNLPTKAICILPPYPRKMGTYVPSRLRDRAFELRENNIADRFLDSHTAIALQAISDLNIKNVYLIGYDGYAESSQDRKAQDLFNENQYLFKSFLSQFEGRFVSLTPTAYDISTSSIYSVL